MKPLLLLLLGFFALAETRADVLGGAVEITPVNGWVRTDPGQPSPFPTLRYEPKDGRNATVLITLIPADVSKVTDLASLKKFHRILQQPYLPTPDTEVSLVESKLPQGFAVYAQFVDPDLVGKPVKQGSYKVSTPVAVLLNGGDTLHVTIFTDSKDSADFQQGLKIVLSASPRSGAAKSTGAAVTSTGDFKTVAFPQFGAKFSLPARFHAMPKYNSSPNYFSFADDKYVNLSGWLDRAAGFKGMKDFWAKEKATMANKTGITVTDETFKVVNGWNAVLYVAHLENMPLQKNIRACRVLGDTWADVHLSTVDPNATWNDLEDVVSALSLSPK